MKRLGFIISPEEINIIENCLICKALKTERHPTTGVKLHDSTEVFTLRHRFEKL